MIGHLISAEKLALSLKEESPIIIDVRTPGEYSSSHIPNSKNFPLGSKELEKAKSSSLSSEKIILVCQGGTRASQCFNEFSKTKNENLFVLEGGINSWEKSGLPTIKGTGAISMERQVRIAAGLFVLIGCILALLINNVFIFIPLFVGSGLIFSGISNTCGMARVLAMMPWNNSSCTSSCGCK